MPERPARPHAPRSRLALALHAGAAVPALGWFLLRAWEGRLAVPALGLGLGLAVGLALWPAVARRVGPRNALRPLLLGWAFLLAVSFAFGVLDLPAAALAPYGLLLGAAASGSAVLERHRLRGARRSGGAWAAAGAAGGLLLWILLAMFGAAWPPLAATMVAVGAHAALRDVPDPVRSDDPVRRFVPWGEADSPRKRPPWRAAAIPAYLAISWAIFVPMADRTRPFWPVPGEALEGFAYRIPDLSDRPLQALGTLATAPWVNGDAIQLVYVSLLLLLFGWAFERHEGALRAAAVFFVCTFVASIVAGILLHFLHPVDPFFGKAWGRVWSGGSAGAFGLMGAFAARARVPWPLLAFFAFWEANVGWYFLRSYTPAFHYTALLTGFLMARLLPPRPRKGAG